MADELVIDDLKTIAKLPKDLGRQALREHFGWPIVDEQEDLRESARLDFFYDLFMFMVKKGFRWNVMPLLTDSTMTVFDSSLGKTIQTGLKIFHDELAQLCTRTDLETLKIYAEYMMAVFFKHFKLRSYVFTRERQEFRFDMKYNLTNPSEPAPLEEAKPKEIYYYEKKMKLIEEKEEMLVKTRGKRKADVENKIAELSKKYNDDVEAIPQPVDQQVLEAIVKEVVATHISSVAEEIKENITDTQEELRVMAAKTCVPRPPVLGPPPRFTIKTVASPPPSSDKVKPPPKTPKTPVKKSR